MNKKVVILLILISASILLCIAGYLFINRGVSIEIANDIEVGIDVVIPASDGNLRGSLFIDEQSGEKSPAIIMIVGSAAVSYRQSWHPETHSMWKPITELLHSNGYAVLLLEKRGINGSDGHWEHQSFEDRADDVKAAIEYLQSRSDIDLSRIGLMGHSQGGWIAQLVAATYANDVAFIVNLAGPSTTVMEQVLDDYESDYLLAGLSRDEIERKMIWNKLLLNFVYDAAPVLKFGNISRIIRYSAEATRDNIIVPVFSVYAENDHLVHPDKNIALMMQGLKSSGNSVYEIHIIPGVNHRFKPAKLYTPNDELVNTSVSDEFLYVIGLFMDWENNLARNE